MSDFREMRRVAWQTVVEAFGLSVSDAATLQFQAPTYTVSTLPAAATHPRGLIYVSDETGGATLAFSDGSVWRRVQDRAQVA
jgi:hypothetical protein